MPCGQAFPGKPLIPAESKVLVRRDLRRWGGGRKSSFVYHYAKKAAMPLILMARVLYLALPFSLHPSWINLPFVLAFAVIITASTL
jgi:integrating conjugative element membrane protein (TIGR03747 family)